ncbi:MULTISPECIES: hypothetical protein [unclassified Amycolatopsis]|uniref:hypothetical protein n=1 Tax=unclassified Amycolatopsis TaxID=2618356 RepID=UPI001C6A5131|nr:hypothetical protein [Amycolatopsis sp. DSM 110486]QYN24105.1 hypothetical protein K1T34_17650 [Amycolatopsis sp. DSM 110486]
MARQHRTRRATALGAAAFVLAGSAALAAPSTASATSTPTTIVTQCGSTITAKPGDTVQVKTLLGLPVDLGVVGQVSGVLTGAVNSVLGALCKVTVNVVNTVVAPVPVVGAPAAGALNQTVAGTTNTLQQGVDSTQRALTGGAPAQQNPGSPQQPPATGPGAPQGGTPAGQTPIPPVNSPLLPLSGGGGGLASLFPGFANFSNLPFSTGYAPMRDYSDIPMAMAGLFSPSPALRYGSQIPGYAPQYGLSNPGQPSAGNASVQNAGEAQALPPTGDNHANGLDWPVLVAVLALSGVSAGLVRTWVLRRMAAAS